MAGEAILVVDDNPMNLKLIKVLLKSEGYRVCTAHDADETLTLLQSFDPKLILMDVQLPGMDGLALTQKLKADEKYKNTIILAVTAYAMKGDEQKVIAAGCDGYISKPINTEDMLAVVSSYLNNNDKESSHKVSENRV